jgi:hypothetical protein
MLSNVKKKIPPKVAPKPDKTHYGFASMIYESENPNFLTISDNFPTCFRGLNKDNDQDHGLQSINSALHAKTARFKLGVGLYSLEESPDVLPHVNKSFTSSSSGIYKNIIVPDNFNNDTTFSLSYFNFKDNEKTYGEDYEMLYERKRFQEHNYTKCSPDNFSHFSSTIKQESRDKSKLSLQNCSSASTFSRKSEDIQIGASCINEYISNIKQLKKIHYQKINEKLESLSEKEEQTQEEVQYTELEFIKIENKLKEVRIYEVDKFKLHVWPERYYLS